MPSKTVALSAAEVFALEYAANLRMHQKLTVPATEHHGPLRVTYAVAGIQTGDVPTILLCSGMYGGRWLTLFEHHMATRLGVRIASVDRPGLGGSTPVEVSQRIQVWLETVPVLMKVLNVKHVALLGTSAGAIYLLNTLYHLPHILSPSRPYAALLAPWVHPSNSKVKLLTHATRIPNFIIANHWNKVSNFMAMTAGPAFKSASRVLSSISRAILCRSKETAQAKAEEEEKNMVYHSADSKYLYGMSYVESEKVFDVLLQSIFVEDTTGGNGEAMLCLKKGGKRGVPMWGVCDNLATYVPDLAQKWTAERGSQVKLKVDAYFAENDEMIGEQGQAYFESCWSEANCGDAITFTSVRTRGTDHDSICDPMGGVLEGVLHEAKWSLSETG